MKGVLRCPPTQVPAQVTTRSVAKAVGQERHSERGREISRKTRADEVQVSGLALDEAYAHPRAVFPTTQSTDAWMDKRVSRLGMARAYGYERSDMASRRIGCDA